MNTITGTIHDTKGNLWRNGQVLFRSLSTPIVLDSVLVTSTDACFTTDSNGALPSGCQLKMGNYRVYIGSDDFLISIATTTGTYDITALVTSAVQQYGDTYAALALIANNALPVVDTVADLASLATSKARVQVLGYHTKGDGGGGVFYWDADYTTAADGGLVFNGVTGRWKREFSGPINVRWFGAKGDGTTDDTDAIQAALDCTCGTFDESGLRATTPQGGEVYIPRGIFYFTDQFTISKPTFVVGEMGIMFNGTNVGILSGTILKSGISDSTKDVFAINGYISGGNNRSLRIEKIAIQGCGTERDGISLIATGSNWDMVLSEIVIQGVGRHGLNLPVTCGPYHYSVFNKLRIGSSGLNNYNIYGPSASSNTLVGVEFNNCYSDHAGQDGFYLNNVYGIKFNTCVENNSGGCGYKLINSKKNVFSNCVAEDCSLNGWYLDGSLSNIFDSCQGIRPLSDIFVFTNGSVHNLLNAPVVDARTGMQHFTFSANSKLNKINHARFVQAAEAITDSNPQNLFDTIYRANAGTGVFGTTSYGTGGTYVFNIPTVQMAQAFNVVGTTTLSYLNIVATTVGTGNAQVVITDTTTDATSKTARYSTWHYTNAEEKILFAEVGCTSGNAYANIGGGSGAYNALAQVNIYCAANNTTVTGTLMARFTTFGLSVGTGVGATSMLEIGGPIATAVRQSAVDTTFLPTDSCIVLTATGKTGTLPSASGRIGREQTLILDAVGTGTLAAASGETINGVSTYPLSARYKYVKVKAITSTSWLIIAAN